MDNGKLIYGYVSDPASSVFKDMRNNAAVMTTVTCSNSGNCGLYASGQCVLVGSLSTQRCEYGVKKRLTGYTKKAKGYYKWINDKRAELGGHVNVINEAKTMIAQVGDYVYLPYAHMNMNERLPFKQHANIFVTGSYFMPMSAFTVNNMVIMVDYRPQALMGGEITSYRADSLPKFLQHLKEKYPDKFNELTHLRPEVLQMVRTTNVGRMALLSSIKPGVEIVNHVHKDKWLWDGVYLHSLTFKPNFLIVKAESVDVKLKPVEGVTVKISDDNQVTPDTIFID